MSRKKSTKDMTEAERLEYNAKRRAAYRLKHKPTALGEKISRTRDLHRDPNMRARLQAEKDFNAYQEERRKKEEQERQEIAPYVAFFRERQHREPLKLYDRKMEIMQMRVEVSELLENRKTATDIATRNKINYKIYTLRKKIALAIDTPKAYREFENEYGETINFKDER